MASRQSRKSTGDPGLDADITTLLDDAGATANRDQLFELILTTLRFAGDNAARLDIKITNAALKEMREAFAAFAPYRDVPKITMFGSARTLPDDPLYLQAKELAAQLAARGWMVVTGAGPGIMAAGLEGAGRNNSFGVNIRLPFEQAANEFIVGDDKLVSMKYFFTRKVMLLKESYGFASLPGGFGTQDETFELLTLIQTGKAMPAPVVLVDVPHGTYWSRWDAFVREELGAGGWISPGDNVLYRVTDDAEEACRELIGFYRNYHSMRYVNGRMMVRMRALPTPEELASLNADFADIVTKGTIEIAEPTKAENRDGDALDLKRLAMHFDRMHLARFRLFVDAVNALSNAPREVVHPPVGLIDYSEDREDPGTE